MKKVLYISNIEVPYRTEFFNQLSEKCDLTVLYERKNSKNRNEEWSKSYSRKYVVKYLNGIKIGNETSFNLKILKYIFGNYDKIIIGCYNSPIEMFAILIMKLFRKEYILNIDGEPFINDKSFKTKLKIFFISGASKYLIAGEESAKSLSKIINKKKIFPYYFSSLTKQELENNRSRIIEKREDFFLVVGQYFDYKGLDIAYQVAKKNPHLNFKFVGMGNRTELFKRDMNYNNEKNIDIIPFLQKKDLEEEYLKCKALILPSRQECWGLVINEAASFGTPIISTYGSGAAIEFLFNKKADFLVESNNINQLNKKINDFLSNKEIYAYEKYLIEKSIEYTIEHSVEIYLNVIEK